MKNKQELEGWVKGDVADFLDSLMQEDYNEELLVKKSLIENFKETDFYLGFEWFYISFIHWMGLLKGELTYLEGFYEELQGDLEWQYSQTDGSSPWRYREKSEKYPHAWKESLKEYHDEIKFN